MNKEGSVTRFSWILRYMCSFVLNDNHAPLRVYSKDSRKTRTCLCIYIYIYVIYSPSDFGAGGLRVAQFVRILLLPSHCPFMAPMALSASWNNASETLKLENNCHFELSCEIALRFLGRDQTISLAEYNNYEPLIYNYNNS